MVRVSGGDPSEPVWVNSQPRLASMNSSEAPVLPPPAGTGALCCQVWPPSAVAKTYSWVASLPGGAVAWVVHAWSASSVQSAAPPFAKFGNSGGGTSRQVTPPSVVREPAYLQPTVSVTMWSPGTQVGAVDFGCCRVVTTCWAYRWRARKAGI